MDEVIIILSEDEDLACDDAHNDSSVLFVEEKKKVVPDRLLSAQALEEDLVVTFSRRAEVLPHARYDCPVYPFTRADFEKSGPIDSNHLICEQCFCYVCDKLASLCSLWRVKDACHCNSHQRSETWSGLRSSAVLGHLLAFDFSLSDVDSHLQLAEMLLRRFRKELAVEYSCFLRGKTLPDYGLQSHQQGLVHDYTPVYECVSSFLSKADEQEGRVAAIMSLGAAGDFNSHYQPPGIVLSKCPKASVTEAKGILLQRVIESVRRLMVMSDLPSAFIHKLQCFYQGLNLHVSLRSMRNSLCVRLWDDLLLVSVLKGQNVTGIRKDRGKKDMLVENISVVLLRVELLQSQCRYRELCRYLRVVQTDDPKLFQELRDLIPLFTCMAGDFSSALSCFFGAVSSPAPRLSPALFRLYLRIFDTATAPRVHISPQTQLDLPGSNWGPIQGAVPLRRAELVKFALRVQRSCAAVNADSQSWAHLITIVNTPRDSPGSCLPEPSAIFLNDAKNIVQLILSPDQGTNIQIPKFFLEVYPDHALLLLVTEALMLRIFSGPLSPSLPVIKSFKENAWALQWLCQNLSSSSEVSLSFMQGVQQELENTGGPTGAGEHRSVSEVSLSFMPGVQQELENTGDNISHPPFEPSSPPPPSSSPEPWDHTYCSPVSVKPCSSKVQSQPQWHLPDHLWSNNGL